MINALCYDILMMRFVTFNGVLPSIERLASKMLPGCRYLKVVRSVKGLVLSALTGQRIEVVVDERRRGAGDLTLDSAPSLGKAAGFRL